MDVFAATLRPDEALLLALGETKIHLAPINIEYKGRLILHTASYTSESDEEESMKQIKDLGFKAEEVPTNSIIGYAKIKNIKIYDNSLFKQDALLHNYGNDFNLFKAMNWQNQTIFGYELENFSYLETPIRKVSKERKRGEWWTPENPFEILCFKKAFEGVLLEYAENV